MVDTVNMKVLKDMARDVDFIEETPCYVEEVSEHYYNGDMVLIGKLKGLKVTMSTRQVKINNGSLCKWYLGDNYKVMGRGDVQRAVEALSDTLHLPMEKAMVTRLDVAQNIITNYPIDVYLNHMGELEHTHRLLQPSGILYKGNSQSLCIYDKNKEQRTKGETIPELYRDRNVLRLEVRWLERLPKQFNVDAVTGAMLSDEAFYVGMAERWQFMYRAIDKINDVTPNFIDMKTKQQFYMMGVLRWAQDFGGKEGMIAQIKEAQKRRELTAKQAYDLKQMVNEAYNIKSGLTVKSDAITELDKKISEAVKYYR